MSRLQFNGQTIQFGGKVIILPPPPPPDQLLKIQIETTQVDQEITIPHLSGAYTYDYVVDYGDETATKKNRGMGPCLHLELKSDSLKNFLA